MSQYPAHDPTMSQPAGMTPQSGQPLQAGQPAHPEQVQVQIEVLPGGGSLAGRQMAFSHGPVKFGRDTTNVILLDNPAVSRFHGELNTGQDGQWLLTNFAANGLKLNGKKVSDTPVTITKVSTISTGKHDLLRVTPFLPAVQEGFDEQGNPIMTRPAAAVMGGTGNRKRMALYIGIGAWLVLLAGLAVFFATLDTSEDADNGAYTALDQADVRAEIMAPMDPRTPNAQAAEEALNRANAAWIEYQAGDPEAAFRAIDHYKRAISFRADGEWQRGEGLMYKRFTTLQEAFAEDFAERYERATRQVANSQWTSALSTLDELKSLYPMGSDSEITASIQSMINYARRQQQASN